MLNKPRRQNLIRQAIRNFQQARPGWMDMVPASGGAAAPVNLILNGDFADTSVWARDAGWTISDGEAHCAGSDIQITQPCAPLGLVNGQSYRMVYTVTALTAGSIIARIGTAFLTARDTEGTYEESGVYDGFTNLGFYSLGFNGSIDNVELYANP